MSRFLLGYTGAVSTAVSIAVSIMTIDLDLFLSIKKIVFYVCVHCLIILHLYKDDFKHLKEINLNIKIIQY